MARITIKRENSQYNVYRGVELLATIHQGRPTPSNDRKDNWNVCWTSGRVDWHGTYGEARDNALKGI